MSWLSALLARHAPPPRRTARAFEPAWWHVMEFDAGPPRSLGKVEARFRRLVAAAHPDRGGSTEHMQRLLRARATARRQMRAR